MAETVKCKALVAFTRSVQGFGMIHGDPDSSDETAQTPDVPVHVVAQFADDGLIVDPDAKARRKKADPEAPPADPADPEAPPA